MFGNCWEWTASGYLLYPGYRRHGGPFAEYNGKFMVNQMVLRGEGVDDAVARVVQTRTI